MKKRFGRLLIGLSIALMMVFSFGVPAFAATDATITVTATPAYIALTVAPNTWTLNDIVGDGVTAKGTIAPDTVYYANPLGDGTAPSATVLDAECQFTITNTSTITTDVTVNIGDFSGGSAAMTNTDTDGSNGAATYGAFVWCSGMTYASKVVCKTTGSAAMKSDLAPTTDLKFGLEIETQTDAWTGGTSSTATITVTLTDAT